MAIQSMGPPSLGMRPVELSLSEQLGNGTDTPEDDGTPAAALSRFANMSDEMAASLRSQFRRANFNDKLEGSGEHFERVLEEDIVPRAHEIMALANDGRRSLQWLLAQARQRFNDPSDLVLVLRQLLQRKDLPPVARQRLEALLQTVLAQTPPKRLKAGINCALKARLFGRKLALRAGLLRESYRSFLDNESDPADSYEEWIALYGYEYRSPVLDFIEAALLADVDSLDPSCSRLEFGALLARLGDLKALRSADALFVQRLLGNAMLHRYEVQEPDWLLYLLGLLRWPDEVEQLLEGVFGNHLGQASASEQAALLNCVRLASVALPLMLFEDDEALMRITEQFDALTEPLAARETIERHARLIGSLAPSRSPGDIR